MDNRLTKIVALAGRPGRAVTRDRHRRRRRSGRPHFRRRKARGDRQERLQSMRAQNKLIAVRRALCRGGQRQESQLGGLVNSERTLIMPGDVRYELDLSKLQAKDVAWDKSTHTLHVLLPEIEIAGPDVDINAVKEYGGGGVLSALTHADQELTRPIGRAPSPTCASRRRAKCRCGWPARQRVPRSNEASQCRSPPPGSTTSRSSPASPPKAVTRLATSTFRPHMKRRSRRPNAAAPPRGRNDDPDRKPEGRRPARRDRAPQAGAQRGHPRPLLPEAGNPGPRRFRRRQPRFVAQGGRNRCRGDRFLRRPLHGRDRENPVTRKDCDPARHGCRLQPRGQLPARPVRGLPQGASGPYRADLHQLLGSGESA